MFSHVLVPLDGSEYSERALNYAVDIAKSTGATVSLLTVILRYPLPNLPRAAELDEHSRKLAEEYLASKAGPLGNIVAKQTVMFGEPAQCITEYAESEGVDLIAMSTHGIGATGKYALGSVAMKVLMTAPCPVLMVRIPD